MEQNKANKAIEELKSLKLTAEEKSAVFQSILEANPIKSGAAKGYGRPVPSPLRWESFPAWIMAQPVRIAVSVLVIVSLTCGGIASAAERALPGEPLFAVKVNVNEPIIDALTTSPIAKAKWQAEKAVRRLDEAATLATKGALTTATGNEIKTLLDAHVEAYSKAVSQIERADPKKATSTVEELDRGLKDSLFAHAALLDKIVNKEDSGGVRAAASASLMRAKIESDSGSSEPSSSVASFSSQASAKKVENDPSKVNHNESENIANSARQKAEKIRSSRNSGRQSDERNLEREKEDGKERGDREQESNVISAPIVSPTATVSPAPSQSPSPTLNPDREQSQKQERDRNDRKERDREDD